MNVELPLYSYIIASNLPAIFINYGINKKTWISTYETERQPCVLPASRWTDYNHSFPWKSKGWTCPVGENTKGN